MASWSGTSRLGLSAARLAGGSNAADARGTNKPLTWAYVCPEGLEPSTDHVWTMRGQMAMWLIRNAPLVIDRCRLRWLEVAAIALGDVQGSILDDWP